MCRGGSPVVSVLAFFSDDPSSNPAEVYKFYSSHCLKRTKKWSNKIIISMSTKIKSSND